MSVNILRALTLTSICMLVRVDNKGWAVREGVDRQGTERRQQLLDAARDVFEVQGFGTATIADITRLAGVSRATFYVYFASKTDVFAILAEHVRDDYLHAQEITGIAEDDVVAVLAATIEATLDVTVKNLALMTVLDHQAIADPQIKTLWGGIRRQTVKRTAHYLERCRDRGLLTLASSAETVAMMGAGMNELFAPLVADQAVKRDVAVTEMLGVFRQLLKT